MTDIKEPIYTTSDGTYCQWCVKTPKKVLLAKSWWGCGPPQPPQELTP